MTKAGTPIIHMWDCQGKELEPIKNNIWDTTYLRCDTQEARDTVSEWLNEEWYEYPDWDAAPNGVWKQIGEDEFYWQDLITLREEALAKYYNTCREIEKFMKG